VLEKLQVPEGRVRSRQLAAAGGCSARQLAAILAQRQRLGLKRLEA
jgi:hypothetical protein